MGRIRRGGRVWLSREEIAQGGALELGELPPEAVGADDRLTLFGRHGPKIENCTRKQTASVRRHACEALDRGSILLPLGDRHPLQGFVALKQTIALLRRHTVELNQPIAVALLHLRREIVEAGLVFEIAQLLRNRLALVVLHPLLQMFLVGTGRRCTGTGPHWRVIRLARCRLRLTPATQPEPRSCRHGTEQRECQSEPN